MRLTNLKNMASNLFFYKGNSDTLKDIKEDDNPVDKIKESFNKVLDGKNLSFLLGSGCSSFYVKEVVPADFDLDNPTEKWTEVGIPTMVPLAKEFYTENLTEKDKEFLLDELYIEVSEDKFFKNIEFFLGVLHSYKFYLDSTAENQVTDDNKIAVNSIILKAKQFIIRKVLNHDNTKNTDPNTEDSANDIELKKIYQTFYRKLLYRNQNLPKANIFTTNYDLYSETALDRLGIHYVNGFSGGIKKYFNPTIFNYALSEKMDLSQSKWNVIDNFIYLYKIHGSVNWIQDQTASKLFKVREIQDATYENLESQETIMIHPTPLKQNASLGSPYSDLFREFQKKLMQNNNILITLGYSFSDEHINNLIYQAFTIPSFRLIIMGDPAAAPEIEKLKSLDDPRIWIIGGEIEEEGKLHYFKGFVNNILPDLTNDQIDNKIENAIKELIKK